MHLHSNMEPENGASFSSQRMPDVKAAGNVTFADKVAIDSLIKIVQKADIEPKWEHQTAVKALRTYGSAAIPEISAAFLAGRLETRKMLLPLLLEHKNAEVVQTLHEMLSKEGHKRVSAAAIIKCYLLFVCFTVPICMAINYFLNVFVFKGHLPAGGMFSSIGTCFILPLSFLSVNYLCQSSDANLRRKSLLALAEVGKTDMVGILAASLSDRDAKVRGIAESALLNLLPLVREESSNLTPLEMRKLIDAVSSKKPELTLAILNALEHIGDAKAIPQIEGLLRELQEAKEPTQSRLWEAADSCLRTLRQRAEMSVQSKTLLRASSASQKVAQTTLLRPADVSGTTEAAELLRATVSTENR